MPERSPYPLASPKPIGPVPFLEHSKPSTSNPTDSLRRIPCLDGIRALAALMVMVFHFAGHHGESSRVMEVCGIGGTGVDLFFVLSGFLITRILLLSRESPHFFKIFYARRILRIFPLYFGFLVIYFLLLPLVYSSAISPFREQVWSWFFLENIPRTFPSLASSGPTHFWTLAVEEHFYLAWPFLVFILSKRQFKYLILITLAVPPMLRLVCIRHGINEDGFTLTRMDSLAYGAWLAMIMTGDAPGSILNVRLFRCLLIAMPLLLVPAAELFFLLPPGWTWFKAAKLSIIPAFYFALIGFCLVDPAARGLSKFFSISWLRWLGGISYGLYVLHRMCFGFVKVFVFPQSCIFDLALSFGLTIGLAHLSFKYFESPILRLRRYFLYGNSP